MKRKMVSVVLVALFGASMLCGAMLGEDEKEEPQIKHFTAFFDYEGKAIDEENDIKKLIADKIGADCEENWLSSQTQESAINGFISSGEYPDFISGRQELYQANALIPIDEYWDDYPNVKNYLKESDWDGLRLEDGHIYWIPPYGVVNGEIKENIHNDEAFWIQTRVLRWAGYPEIRTLDEYFDLIERYIAANPTMPNGTANIGYTILCDDWRYFCLENAPQFLDGYPNDGSCMVDPETNTVMDYNTTETAKKYFKKLNEEFKKGIIDPESFTSTYEEYLEKLCTGAVLGMVDQWWEFNYSIGEAYSRDGLRNLGCDYVPLPITIDRSVKNMWHVKSAEEVSSAGGLSITVSCQDIPGAMQFINDLLDPEIQNLRFWGVKGEDYEVDDNGAFYITKGQMMMRQDRTKISSHFCNYSSFPRVEGIMPDGINAFSPENQGDDFMKNVATDIQECFKAYGCSNYVDMLGTNDPPGKWFPMYTYSSQLTYDTEAGRIWKSMEEIKHIWLPQVVTSDNFEETWENYLDAYNECRPEIFFNNMQQELNRRISK